MYYIYMLRCMDNSIYTGITTDIERRMNEHFSKDKRCAKYTETHTPKKLESLWETDTRVFASKLEYHIKSLTKKQKESLIVSHDLQSVLKDKVDIDRYRVVSI